MNNQRCGVRLAPVLACLCACLFVNIRAAETFETPDILKDNVVFWQKVYTELSLGEGVLHDPDHPLIIYKRFTAGDRQGNTSGAVVRGEKATVEAMLRDLASNPDSTWTEEEKAIAAQYAACGAQADMATAVQRMRFQQGQRERFYEGLCRSAAYLDTIRSILAQFDVPADLAFLPHVESSFNPYANSKVGAAGLWQFMRSTGRLYLKIDYLIDQRRDPILSTYAAAKLLSHNYEELQSWPLAITAYNYGLGGMKHAVETTGSRDIAIIIARHHSRTFKFASKNFYGCFLAVRSIAADPSKYFAAVEYAPKWHCTDVELPQFMTPSVVATFLGVNAETLARLNPALRPVVFQREKAIPKGIVLHVPPTVELASATTALASVPDSLKADEQSGPGYYEVHRGDNLAGIASQLGVRIQDLANENDLSRTNRIYAGQVLRVPSGGAANQKPILSFVAKGEEGHLANRPKPQPPLAAAAAPRTEAVSAVPPQAPAPAETAMAMAEQQWPPPAVPPPAQQFPSAPARPAVVAALPKTTEALADTFKQIALTKAETMSPVSGPSASTPAGQFDAEVYDLDMTISPVGNTASIKVSVDETVGHYAEWLGVASWCIRQMNRLGNKSAIRIGERLSIPADPATLDRFIQARLEYHMAVEEDFYSQFKVAEVKPHAVVRGENEWTLCNNADGEIPQWLLRKYNRQVDLSALMPGAVVWIPVVAEKTAEDYKDEGFAPAGGYPYYSQPLLPPCKPLQRVP